MIANGDTCPICKEPQLPKWNSPVENARCCQKCGYTQEREADLAEKGD